MRLYESMVIVDNNKARSDFDGAVNEISEIIAKHEGKVVKAERWDERKLAYPINGHKKGTYVLFHFEAPPVSIKKISNSFRLNTETIIRAMIVKDEDGIEISERHSADQAFGNAPEETEEGQPEAAEAKTEEFNEETEETSEEEPAE